MHCEISVVIPTHNRERGVRRALESIAAQTAPPAEIIVVDDASTVPFDRAIFEEVGIAAESVVLRNEQSRGANVSRNIGVRAAASDFVAFLDDDDEFHPEKIEAIERVASRGIADVIYHPALMVYDKENIRYVSHPGDQVDFRRLLVGNAVGGTSMVSVNRQKFLDAGGFDEALPALQDYEAWLRCAKAGYRFLKVARPLTTYHHVTGQGSISKSLEKLDTALHIIAEKYAEDIRTLTPAEHRALQRTNISRRVHRMLMREENWDAASVAITGGFKERDGSLVLGGWV
jgi:glycosyltransferase involved in cell wall biosynthesis